jgi:hypothetical protein
VARHGALVAYLRAVALGVAPVGGWAAVRDGQPRVGVGARPPKARRRARKGPVRGPAAGRGGAGGVGP